VEVTPAAHAAALWAGLSLILLLVLSVLVVRQRQKHQVLLGDGGVPELAQAIRAFGNAAEYIAPGLAGLAILAIAGAPAYAIHTCGGVLFLGRVTHAVALSRSSGATRLRAAGMVLTWLAFILEAVGLLLFAPG